MTVKYPATQVVHCPNGPVKSCDKHAEQITRLMQFLGGHVVHTVPDTQDQCANCVNEAKAREATHSAKEEK